MTHSHEITGSTPMLQQLSYFIWELVGFGSGDGKSQNKHGDMYKVALVVLQGCDCNLQLDGKHIKSTPYLRSEVN